MQRLIVLGTGQAVCLHYHNTCFALETDGEIFLIDGGGGGDILRCFQTAGLDWTHMHHAFLSHEHTDHLLGMVWVVRYVAELINWNRYNGDFTIFTHDVAAEKLLTVCRLLLKPAQSCLLGTRIHIQLVVDGEAVRILNDRYTFFDIHSCKAKQFGFRLEADDGRNLVFLGDEPFNDACARYMRPCQWLLSEAYCLYGERNIYNPYELFHSTVKEACACAQRFGVQNLVLWHTEDESTFGFRKDAYTKEASQFFAGKVYVPDDFDVIQL